MGQQDLQVAQVLRDKLVLLDLVDLLDKQGEQGLVVPPDHQGNLVLLVVLVHRVNQEQQVVQDLQVKLGVQVLVVHQVLLRLPQAMF